MQGKKTRGSETRENKAESQNKKNFDVRVRRAKIPKIINYQMEG